MTRYSQHVNDLRTPQSDQARADQVKNNAGGFVFTVDKWVRLDRFLILGSEGGTYYVDEKKLTKENAAAVRECIAEDGQRTVSRIIEISDAGRSPKNDPAIFALAMCAGANDAKTRQSALAAIPRVCRIGTHLFHFAADVEGFRRWGRSLRRAVAAWYCDRSVEALAHQAIKYQSRDKWSHRDLLRLSHAQPPSAEHDAVFRWITHGPTGMPLESKRGKPTTVDKLPAVIQAFEEVHSGVDVKRAVALIREHKLPHECVPNEIKDRPEVWEALLENMGLTAMIRNLGKMTSVGVLAPLCSSTRLVVDALTDLTRLRAGRVHPMAVLLAMKTYQSGHGFKGSLSWTPAREVVDALDAAFYAAFQAVEPTGKSHLLALDVSGSMSATIAGTHLSCREASAAMAMVTARTEKHWHCVGFTAGARGFGGMHGGGPSGLTPLTISPRQRMDDVVRTMNALPMGGTDCALPMLYAAGNELEVDVFHVYTDNETWAGAMHPFQALRAYRAKSGRPAKLVVVGMTSNGFTIADPTDAGMLDFVGFDAAAPALIADFARDPLDGDRAKA